MWGLNDVLTHSIAYGMGEEEGRAKAEREKKASSNWHTGTPTEGEDYLVQYKNGGHDVLHFANLRWFAFNRGGVEWQKIPDSSVVAWQKIEPYKEKEDGREETETIRH